MGESQMCSVVLDGSAHHRCKFAKLQIHPVDAFLPFPHFLSGTNWRQMFKSVFFYYSIIFSMSICCLLIHLIFHMNKLLKLII
ncbi:hypothetical protein T01_5391 [Trichinella spiralis]|uniref:Uncharacterized protein n=1 Tax=Trichinella spiralis TaxID=6334 RepID=A0A0V1B949_TRISP|nr:hypothetical protein T01_5391 [Trichinella spiralis]